MDNNQLCKTSVEDTIDSIMLKKKQLECEWLTLMDPETLKHLVEYQNIVHAYVMVHEYEVTDFSDLIHQPLMLLPQLILQRLSEKEISRESLAKELALVSAQIEPLSELLQFNLRLTLLKKKFVRNYSQSIHDKRFNHISRQFYQDIGIMEKSLLIHEADQTAQRSERETILNDLMDQEPLHLLRKLINQQLLTGSLKEKLNFYNKVNVSEENYSGDASIQLFSPLFYTMAEKHQEQTNPDDYNYIPTSKIELYFSQEAHATNPQTIVNVHTDDEQYQLELAYYQRLLAENRNNQHINMHQFHNIH